MVASCQTKALQHQQNNRAGCNASLLRDFTGDRRYVEQTAERACCEKKGDGVPYTHKLDLEYFSVRWLRIKVKIKAF